MLAYSSISHAGYLLITVLAKVPGTNSSLLFYSLAYAVATISAFAVLIVVSEAQAKAGKPDESFDALNGLAAKNPFLAFVLAVSMLSLAGIPLTAGFFGKFFIFADAFSHTSSIFKGILTIAVLMSDALGAGWNIIQSKIAIGSGGFTGKGYLEGTQSHLGYLPEHHTDFIMSTYAEEFGFIGVFLLFSLFAAIILRCLMIGMNSFHNFGRLYAGTVGHSFYFV